MDKKVAKTPGVVSKKKGTGVPRAVCGAVVSATSSGGAPTSFKTSNKRQPKLKTQEKKGVDEKDVAAVAALVDLTTKVDFKALARRKKSIEKMEYEKGQQTTEIALPADDTSMDDLPLSSALPIAADAPMDNLPLSSALPTATDASIDDLALSSALPAATDASIDDLAQSSALPEDDDDFSLPKVFLLDDTIHSPATVPKKRKLQTKSSSQRASTEIKEKALKRMRKVPLPPPPVPADLLEDSSLKKMASEEKYVFEDIAANIASKEKVEKQLAESSKKLQELSSESEILKQKEAELLTELGELRKAAETSAAAKKDLEQRIEMSKAELEQAKRESSIELQKIRTETAAEKERIKEIEARNASVLSELEQERSKSGRTIQAAEETERRAAETMASNQKEIERLRRDLEANSVARAKEMLLLQTESEARIRKLEEMLQNKAKADLQDIQAKERDIEMLRKELLANKSRVDVEMASVVEKTSRLETAEARTKHLEKQLAELHLAKEEERRLLDEQTALSERKMQELRTQLELQKKREAEFMQSVEANQKDLRERFIQEKEMLQRELDETAASRIAATQIAEKLQKESEMIQNSIENANRLVREAEERRAIAEKREMEKTNELQEIQRQAREESERLKREKRDLIKKIEDAERQQDKEAMAMEQYIPSYQNMVVSEVSNAMGTIQKQVMDKNEMFMEDITKSINDLKDKISSSGQELVIRQDSQLAEGIKRFGDLIKNSMDRGEEIQEIMNDMIRRVDVKTTENHASVSTAVDVVKRLGNRIVEDMDHDDPSDTNKIRLTWNFIKQSLINMLSTTYMEINNLRMVVRRSNAIRDKEYVESTKNAAERAFFLLMNNKDLENVLSQLAIGVKFHSSVDPNLLEVEVMSIGNLLNDDIKTIKINMSMASATYREIENILSGVRVIAAQFANTERQSLQEIETNKIIDNLEDSTASRLYYELDKFYFSASTIEDVVTFQAVMRENPSLLKTFEDAIPFLGSRKDNREVIEFLRRKGYSLREDMASSIDNFLSNIMSVELLKDSGRERRRMDENVFISTVIGILATVSEAIQKIDNKIEEERKKMEIRANEMESRRYLEEQLQDQKDLIAMQRQPTRASIATEFQEVEEGIVPPLIPAEELRNEIRQITNIVKESEEKHTQDINFLIDSAIKNAYEDILDRLTTHYEESVTTIQAQQLEQQRQSQEQTKREQEEPRKRTEQTRDRQETSGVRVTGGDEERRDDCFRRVLDAVITEFRSNIRHVHDNLKKSVERLIVTTLSTAPSKISASNLNNLKRAADTYIRDMSEQFKIMSTNLPIDALQKIKTQCTSQGMFDNLPSQLSREISSVISEVDDHLSQYKTELYSRIADLRNLDMEVTEDKSTNEMKERLTNALTRATEAAELSSTEEKVMKSLLSDDRNIRMFLRPEEKSNIDFVEVNLSSKDSGPRNINTEGLKKALPDMSSSKKASLHTKKNNTLTGEIFMDTLKDKVFPYSSKSALENEDEEGGPATLYHPEYFRSSFSKHFIRDSTSLTEPPTFAEKSESVRNFTRLLEYSLFNDTTRGARNDNNMLSRLIYVVFEHDAKMIRYLSDITFKFREYARRGNEAISLYRDRGTLLEATIATIFSAALPVISSMVPRIAEAVSEPVHDDVRIRSTYSLLSLIEKFIFCASKRVHVLKDVLEKSGLVNRLSLYPADANADKVTSFDVQYDYSLLRMLLELMTINITNLIDAGIRPLKAVVLSMGTFTGADKTRETDRAFIPIDADKNVLSKVNDSEVDVPKTKAVVNYLLAVTNWYIANRFNDNDANKESLNKAVDLMYTLLMDNLGAEFATELKTRLVNAAPSTIVEYISKTLVPKLNTLIEEIIKKTKSNDAILVKGASEVGSLGEMAVNVSLGVSREHLSLPWLEVDFRGGINDSTLLWVLSSGEEDVRDYQLAVPLYSSTIRKRSVIPLHVKPLVRIINNTSGSDNVFLPIKKTPGKGGDRVHVIHLAKNVSCVLEYSTKDRYEIIINKIYRDGLILVKGDAEVPRVSPTLDGKWLDNSRDNRTFTPLSVSKWKIPSASLVYGMLSKKKTKEEEDQKKTNAPSVIDFMGGRAGDVLLKMLTLPSEQPIVATSNSDASNKGLWKTNKDGYTSIDAQSMMARLTSDDRKPTAASSMAMVPYSDAANIVVNDSLEVYNNNNSWWIRGIQSDMRRDAAALSAVQEHLYFVQTPIF